MKSTTDCFVIVFRSRCYLGKMKFQSLKHYLQTDGLQEEFESLYSKTPLLWEGSPPVLFSKVPACVFDAWREKREPLRTSCNRTHYTVLQRTIRNCPLHHLVANSTNLICCTTHYSDPRTNCMFG